MTRGAAVLALAVFSALAVALTWPVAARLTAAPAGDGADALLFTWNHWWFARALADGASPYSTDAVYWPAGTDLWLHTLSPLNSAVAAALAPAFGLAGAYNVLLLASFAIAAWSAWLLARDVTGSTVGAYAAGLAFGFAPYHYAHALGHLNLVWYAWLALFALALRRHLASGSRASLALSAAALVAAGLTDLALLLVLAIFGVAFALATLGWRNRLWLRRLALPGLVAAAALSPLLLMVVWSYWTAPGLAGFGDEAPRYSLDVLSYAVPTTFSTLYGGVGLVLTPEGTETEATVFLGFVVLALAAVGLARDGPAARPWAWTALVFYVLSLGPRLQVAGFRTPIPLPYALLQHVPLLSTLRTPARFAIGVMLGVAVLAAFGAAHLASSLPARLPRPWARSALAAAAAALLLAELVVVPFPVEGFTPSPAYARLADEAPAALVELPLHQRGYAGYLQTVRYMSAQTTHGVPLVNGYTSRETPRDTQFLKGELVLSTLWRAEQGGLPPDAPDIVVNQTTRDVAGRLLEARGLTTLLVHRSDAWRATEAREIAWLRELRGVEQVDVVGDVLVFRAAAAGPAPAVLVDLGPGWHGLETWDGAPFRWTFEEATMHLDARENGTATVRLQALPFLYYPLEARTVDVLADGVSVARLTLPAGWSNVTFEAPVRADATTTVVLRCAEPAASPLRLGLNEDPRPLGVAVRNVTVTARA